MRKATDKKGFMKTVEVFIAAMITFTFVLIILPPNYDYRNDLSDSLLDNIEDDEDFRRCVIEVMEQDKRCMSSDCIKKIIRNSLYGDYNYTCVLFDNPTDGPEPVFPESLADREIFSHSIVFSGNTTYHDPHVFKLFYWSNKD